MHKFLTTITIRIGRMNAASAPFPDSIQQLKCIIDIMYMYIAIHWMKYSHTGHLFHIVRVLFQVKLQLLEWLDLQHNNKII